MLTYISFGVLTQMAKQRVYEVAEDLKFDKRELVKKINGLGLGFKVNDYMSLMTDDQVSAFKAALEKERQESTKSVQLDKGLIRRRRKGGRRKVAASESAEAPAPEAKKPAVRTRKKVAPAASNTPPKPVIHIAPEKKEPVVAVAKESQSVEKTSDAKVAASAKTEATSAPEAKAAQEKAAPAAKAEEKAASSPAENAPEDAQSPDKSAPKPARWTAPGTSNADATPAAANNKGSKGKGPGGKGAKVLGRIDPAVLKARLAAEGKSFKKAGGGGGGGGRDGNRGGGRGGRNGGPPRGGNNGGGGGGAGRGPAPGGNQPGNAPANPNNRPGGGRNNRRRRRATITAEHLYDQNAKLRRMHQQRNRSKSRPSKTQVTQAAEHKRVIKVNEAITLSDLSRQMGVKGSHVIRELMKMGEMYTINQAVDVDTASLIAENFGYSVENTTFDLTSYMDAVVDNDNNMTGRAPVVTIMGHVDHGKTTLLDALRSSNVAGGEHGGITQHIGAYQVELNGNPVTVLDTPGHQAFTALRARGAKATDLVILVVAADDGVMPQTVEAINHSRAAGVPIIVAVNKIDKAGANPDRVKQALTEYELIPEDWGGETQFVEVSALKGTNIEGLLEAVLLQSEILELQANPSARAQGLVIESRLDIGLGPVATVLVQRGTLEVGQYLVIDKNYGRVRNMYDDRGNTVLKAGPSTPVQVTGLSGVPEAGEIGFVVEEEKTAREIVSNVERMKREAELANRARKPAVSIERLTEMIEQGEVKELKVIVKADVQGSVEAVCGSLGKLGNEEVKVRIIHSAVGGITENDINLASSSDEGALIVGFNVRPEARAGLLAEERGVELLLYSVIYDVEAVIKNALEGLLSPIIKEQKMGVAEVRETFNVPKVGTIAGCYVLEGKIQRNAKCRIIRDSKVVYDSSINTLKRFKDDAKEVKTGFECGLSITNYNDIKVGDHIEVYELVEEAAKLK